MLKAYENYINNHLPFIKGKRLLIAVSGGVDSVVLTHLCHKLRFDISLAHCNFNLRGKESDLDEMLVNELAEALNIESFVQHFDTKTYAEDHKLSIQMAARELRYNWFRELAAQLQFDYIVTAHHADDNLETFIINFLRGTGLNGLTGIPEYKDNIIRPLLSFSRTEILDYASSEKIEWREDLSNHSRKYLRNKLRHEVVPILKAINPELLSTFQQTLSNLNDTSDIVEEALSAFSKKAIVNTEEGKVEYDVLTFKSVNNTKAYMYETFKAYGFTEWNDVVDLLDAQSGKQVRSATHRLVKHRTRLILSVLKSEEFQDITITEADEQIVIPSGTLSFETVEDGDKNTSHSIYVDKRLLKYPLRIRTRQEGDVFYPYGMKGKKKLSKYFKDEKYSLPDKEQALLLSNADDQILWIIGKRADNRYRVTKNTTEILKIKYEDKR